MAVDYGYCGMPCALCTRHRTEGKSRCPGCSADGYYTEMCKVHHCCRDQKLVHCGVCPSYPCARVEKLNDFTDLNTGGAKRRTLETVAKDGFKTWYAEYAARAELLDAALQRYNNGRMKRYLCELFLQNDLDTLQTIMDRAESLTGAPKELGEGFKRIAEELRTGK